MNCLLGILEKTIEHMGKKAVIAGASGLIGSELLKILVNDPEYSEVVALVRTPLGFNHSKFIQIAIDFDKLEEYSHLITGDAIFCTLGSTRKKTPDLKVYRKIDHDYPVQLARIAATNGIAQYHLISSCNADSKASNYYTKMKGEAEEDVKAEDVLSLVIYRPSLLIGNRKESRLGEGLMQGLSKIINPLLMGSFKKYRSIEAKTVANAMVKLSHTDLRGIYVYESDDIQAL